MDFGMIWKEGILICKVNGSIFYILFEICEVFWNENIMVVIGGDVWVFVVLLFCMMIGNFLWENVEILDVYYMEFVNW